MASATNAAIKAIETHLATNWSSTSIAWPGVHFEPSTSPYIRPTTIMSEATDWTMGGTGAGLNIVPGLFVVDFFATTGAGYGVLRGHVDTFRDLYDRATIGIVRFRAASGPSSLDLTDTGWIGLQVSVPFSIEETT